ncbi:MAG: 4Fe-4S binding protein [Methanobacteriaceae archaeon]|nr:4Fe-4S binding protein [Methanobacteriaceae archaeon]
MSPFITIKNPLKCYKCNLCMKKCKEIHGSSRIKKIDGIPVFCKQCKDAPCKKACKVNAITLKNNVPVVNEELCVGCNLCVDACPEKSIFLKDLTAHKCTLCMDSAQIIPACIEACPDKILVVECEEDKR